MAVAVNPSLAVGAGSPPQPCANGGPVGQGSPPIDCPKIAVRPTTNLIDLQQVAVSGRDFTPSAQIATIQCAAGASGQDQCDLNTLTIVPSSTTGTFSLKRFVRRIISPFSGTVDCASAPGACIMASANINNFLEAAAVPLSFNPAVPPAVPAVFALPSTGLVDHQLIKVQASGFLPNFGFPVTQCASGVTPSYQSCDFSNVFVTTDVHGAFTTLWPVHRILFLQTGTLDCASRVAACEVVVGQFFGGSNEIASAPLAFNPRVPPVVQKLASSATTGLRDHQLVQLNGTGFTPGDTIVLQQCESAPGGIGACDFSAQTTATADLKGRFTVTYALHRIIGVFGPGTTTTFDCASAPNACVLSASNYFRFNEAASTPLSFDPKIPPVTASITVVPSTRLLDNALVTVTGTGYTPYSVVEVVQCGSEAATEGNLAYCSNGGGTATQTSGTGTFSATLFVHRAISGQTGLIDCAAKPGACVVAGTRFTLTGDTAFKAIAFR